MRHLSPIEVSPLSHKEEIGNREGGRRQRQRDLEIKSNQIGMSSTGAYPGTWAHALVKVSPYAFSTINIDIAIDISVLSTAWSLSILYSLMSFPSLSFIFMKISFSKICENPNVVIMWLLIESNLISAVIKAPRITSKNLIRYSIISSYLSLNKISLIC